HCESGRLRIVHPHIAVGGAARVARGTSSRPRNAALDSGRRRRPERGHRPLPRDARAWVAARRAARHDRRSDRHRWNGGREGLRLFATCRRERSTSRILAYLCLAMIDLPILFIHGFPFDNSMWRHQIAALSRWERIVPDLWGAGLVNVPASAGPYSIADQATSLVGMLDDLQVDQVVVCSQSMGGYITFELLRAFPTRVRAAIL